MIRSLDDAPPSKVAFGVMIAEGGDVVAYGHPLSEDENGRTAPRAFCDAYRFRSDKTAELTAFLVDIEPSVGSGV